MRLQYIYYSKEREPSISREIRLESTSPAFHGFRNLPRRSEIRARLDSIQETKT